MQVRSDWELSVVLKYMVSNTDWLCLFVQWRLRIFFFLFLLSTSFAVLELQGKIVKGKDVANTI